MSVNQSNDMYELPSSEKLVSPEAPLASVPLRINPIAIIDTLGIRRQGVYRSFRNRGTFDG